MSIERKIMQLEIALRRENNRIHQDPLLIAALETAIKALELQQPQKPIEGVCPTCGSRDIYTAGFLDYKCFDHCGRCGQAIDWRSA